MWQRCTHYPQRRIDTSSIDSSNDSVVFREAPLSFCDRCCISSTSPASPPSFRVSVLLIYLSTYLPTYPSIYLSLTHHTPIPFSLIQQAEHVRNKKRAFHDMPEALVLLQRKNKSPLYRIQEQVAEQNCCFQVSQYTWCAELSVGRVLFYDLSHASVLFVLAWFVFSRHVWWCCLSLINIAVVRLTTFKFSWMTTKSSTFTCRWFEYRAKAEAFYGIPINPEPCTGRYHGKYSPMKLDDAVTPRHFRKLPFYPDESPDVLLPIGNTGYTGNTYHWRQRIHRKLSPSSRPICLTSCHVALDDLVVSLDEMLIAEVKHGILKIHAS